MKGPNFKPPVFHDLIKRIGSPTNNPVEKYWSASNTILIANLIKQVKEFHRMLGHPIGMIRWGKEEGAPGGLSEERITLRMKVKKEEFDELKNGCLNQDWKAIIDGIGDLEYVILETVVKLGISVDVLLNPEMIEGTMTLNLRAIPREIRQ